MRFEEFQELRPNVERREPGATRSPLKSVRRLRAEEPRGNFTLAISVFMLSATLVGIPTTDAQLTPGRQTLVEDFESGTIGIAPTDQFYVLSQAGGGAAHVASTRSIGTKSFYYGDESTGVNNAVTFDYGAKIEGLNLCLNFGDVFQHVRFAINFEALPSAGGWLQFDTAGGTQMGMRLHADGSIQAQAVDVAQIAGPGSIVTNTWYNFTFTFFVENGLLKSNVYITELNRGATASWPGACSDVKKTRIQLDDNARTARFYVDNLALVNVDVPAPTVASAASVAVTGLVGGDVEPASNVIIARTDAGASDKTYSGTTLSLIASDSTNCNRVDGVLAQGVLVGYVHCDGTQDPTHLKIRTAALATPTLCSYCDADVSLSGFSSAGGDGLGKIGRIEAFPIDRQVGGGCCGLEFKNLAWAWAGIGGVGGVPFGRIGVNGYSNLNNGPDARKTAEAEFGPTDAEDVCVSRDGTQTYMVGAGTDTTTKVYVVNFAKAGLDKSVLEPSLAAPVTFATQYGNAHGIDCAGPRLIVATGTKVFGVARSGATSHEWTKTVTTQIQRGVAISNLVASKQWAAYVDGPTIRVVNALNGTAEGTITMPAGDYKLMRWTNGNDLIVFTSTTIARFSLGGVGTIPIQNPPTVGVNDGAGGTPGGGTEDGGALGSKIPGGSNPTFIIAASLITILIFGAAAHRLTGGRRT